MKQYKTDTIELYNNDCLKILPQLLNEGYNGKIDLILTDPPYLMKYHSGWRKDSSHKFCKQIKNDDNFKLIHDFIGISYSLLKEKSAIYSFCNSNHIDYFKQEFDKKFNVKNVLIWKKNNWSAGDLISAYAKQTEFIIYANKGRHILNGGRDPDILEYDRIVGKKQLHQNQKPVKLLEYLIKKSSKSNDLILDPFMGSGSTGVACMNTGRRFIGIEQDPEYYNIAVKRIKNRLPL